MTLGEFRKATEHLADDVEIFSNSGEYGWMTTAVEIITKEHPEREVVKKYSYLEKLPSDDVFINIIQKSEAAFRRG